jgi:hypothetical protein
MNNTYTWDKAIAETVPSNSVKEFHDYCNVVGAEKHVGQTGKTSIKLNFVTADGGTFRSFMGIADKAGEITVQRLVKLLVKAVGEEAAKRIFDKVADDEDVNTDKEFVLELANKVDKKLSANPVKVYADRTKNGENWQVKWYFEKPQTSNAADAVVADNAAAALTAAIEA